MAIQVVCPGCRKRFQVSDQFAGRTGPCPNCKANIQIPTAKDEVKIHAPELHSTGGKTATGQLVLKPIQRTEVRFSAVAATLVSAATLAVLAVAFSGRAYLAGGDTLHRVVQAAGLLIVSLPLAIAGYWFLYNDELEPYRGKSLYLRSSVLALIYAILWAVFAFTPLQDLARSGEVWVWIFVVPPFFVAGGLAALACLDLDFGSALSHYAFYLLATSVLGWAAGLGWPWQMATTAI